MRYYNENPQVTLWRKRYEKSKEENVSLKEANGILSGEIEETRIVASKWKERCLKVDELNDKYISQVVECDSNKRYFNSLPWYKKMFFKFKV